MNNISKDFTDEEGNIETVIASSSDQYKLDMDKKYVLANRGEKIESKLSKRFKKTLIGADIGVKSGGFSSVAILATVISIMAFVILYFIWKL